MEVDELVLTRNVVRTAPAAMTWEVFEVMDYIGSGFYLDAKRFGTLRIHCCAMKVICRCQARSTVYEISNMRKDA